MPCEPAAPPKDREKFSIQRTDCRVATFTEKANFVGMTFTEKADFSGTTFTKTADFGNAIFTEGANFRGAIFTILGAVPFLVHFGLPGWRGSLALSVANTFGILGFRREFFPPSVITDLPWMLKLVSGVQTVAGGALFFCLGCDCVTAFVCAEQYSRNSRTSAPCLLPLK
jgi:hypothetical protein